MKLGLIGYPLGHSWSPEIHHEILGCEYQLWPLQEEELQEFMEKRDFDGINVTIPYKKTIMQYLDEIDETAAQIGAVNCVVNRNGKLKGYNTDYEGLADMLMANGADPAGRRCAVLGSGGASAAACAAIRKLNGIPVIVSRTAGEGKITYEDLYEQADTFPFLINTTPVGMAPNADGVPVDLNRLPALETVVDIIANPLCTRLRFEAKIRGIRNLGGFEMLVRQAFIADELFTGEKLDPGLIRTCMRKLLQERCSIVVIGMPTSGKTTLSAMLGDASGREVIEMDDEIIKILGTSIKECFAEKGEAYFRSVETEVAKSLRGGGHRIISCGGGIIKNEDNMRYLSENGYILWLQRDLEQLYPSDSRPLSSTHDSVRKLYEERRPLYEKYCDAVIDNTGDIRKTLEEMLEISR